MAAAKALAIVAACVSLHTVKGEEAQHREARQGLALGRQREYVVQCAPNYVYWEGWGCVYQPPPVPAPVPVPPPPKPVPVPVTPTPAPATSASIYSSGRETPIVCGRGYRLNTATLRCVDVNECRTAGLDKCSKNGHCYNTLGSFYCRCKAGYRGNGLRCIEDKGSDSSSTVVPPPTSSIIVPTTIIPPPPPTTVRPPPTTTTTTTAPTIAPQPSPTGCPVGFIQAWWSTDGACLNINECLGTTNRCSVQATCEDTLGSYTCTCKSGWTGDGVNCNFIPIPVTTTRPPPPPTTVSPRPPTTTTTTRTTTTVPPPPPTTTVPPPPPTTTVPPPPPTTTVPPPPPTTTVPPPRPTTTVPPPPPTTTIPPPPPTTTVPPPSTTTVPPPPTTTPPTTTVPPPPPTTTVPPPPPTTTVPPPPPTTTVPPPPTTTVPPPPTTTVPPPPPTTTVPPPPPTTTVPPPPPTTTVPPPTTTVPPPPPTTTVPPPTTTVPPPPPTTTVPPPTTTVPPPTTTVPPPPPTTVVPPPSPTTTTTTTTSVPTPVPTTTTTTTTTTSVPTPVPTTTTQATVTTSVPTPVPTTTTQATVTTSVPTPVPTTTTQATVTIDSLDSMDPCYKLKDDQGRRVRREWRELTDVQRQNYLSAVKELVRRGQYRNYLPKHEADITDPFGHASNAFLHWHRYFIWLFEEQLRSLGGNYSCITLPYWDWTMDLKDDIFADPVISVVQDFGGVTQGTNCLDVNVFGDLRYPPTNECVTRPFKHPRGWRPPGPIEVAEGILNLGNFTAFSDRHKGWHAIIHNRMRGTMQDVQYSPNDPIFFLHHTMVDKVFATWQQCHGHDRDPGAFVPPALYEQNFIEYDHGFDTIMKMLEDDGITPRKVNVISRIGRDGYTYSADRMETGSGWTALGSCTTRLTWNHRRRSADAALIDARVAAVEMRRRSTQRRAVESKSLPQGLVVSANTEKYVPPTTKKEYPELFDAAEPEDRSILRVANTCQAIYNRAKAERPTMDNREVLKHARNLECQTFRPYGPLDAYWQAKMGLIGRKVLPCEDYSSTNM